MLRVLFDTVLVCICIENRICMKAFLNIVGYNRWKQWKLNVIQYPPVNVTCLTIIYLCKVSILGHVTHVLS